MRKDRERAERRLAEQKYGEFADGRERDRPSLSYRAAGQLARGAGRKVDTQALLDSDPDFSEIVFRELALRLYVEAYRAVGDPLATEALTPYLSDKLCDELRGDLRGALCQAALVGELRIEGYAASAETITISVVYTGNIHVDSAEGREDYTAYVVERWEFTRHREARTRPPKAIRQLGCPSCGAAFVRGDQRRCAYCDEVVEDGRLEWRAESRRVQTWEFHPPTLTSSVAEIGTHEPTILQPGVELRLAKLMMSDPSVSIPALNDRVAAIYAALNDGWNADEPQRFRPYVSDALFDYLRYWLTAYRSKKLRNQVKEMRVTLNILAKVERDTYFDAVTIRVFARGFDFTLNSDDKIVSGSSVSERAYSEYWTLIRGRGASPASSDGCCPACSAMLTVNMAGQCDACGAHMTLGEFDWVLSRIEQDEVYRC